MRLIRTDQGRIVIGVLIGLLIFLAAITPARCQPRPLASWNDGPNEKTVTDIVDPVTKRSGANSFRSTNRSLPFITTVHCALNSLATFKFDSQSTAQKPLAPQRSKWNHLVDAPGK